MKNERFVIFKLALKNVKLLKPVLYRTAFGFGVAAILIGLILAYFTFA